MANKMKIIIITLACTTLSQATVLKWLGLDNNNEPIPLSYPPQILPPTATLHIPGSEPKIIKVHYDDTPVVKLQHPTPLNFLNVVQPRRPLNAGVFPVRLIISNGNSIGGLPLNVKHEDSTQKPYLRQYLSYQTDQGYDYAPPDYDSESRNRYPSPNQEIHTASELVRPVINNDFRPGFIQKRPQQYPLPNNHLNLPSGQVVTPTISIHSLQIPNYQHLPYPSQPTDFGRPVYNAGAASSLAANVGTGAQQEQAQPLPSQSVHDFNDNGDGFAVDGEVHNVDRHSYQLENGTKVSEQTSVVTSADGNDEHLVKTGEYEFIDEDGKLVKVKWVADDNGFRIVS